LGVFKKFNFIFLLFKFIILAENL